MATRIQQFPFGVGGGGGLNDVVDDLTPQYGGNMDMNGFNLVASNADGPEILDVAASATVATLKPDRAVNSGLGTSGVSLDLIVNGLSRLRIGTGVGNPNTVLQPLGTSGLFLGSVSGSFGLHNLAASATVPTLLPNFLFETTGVGLAGPGEFSVITDGIESLRIDSAGDTFLRQSGASFKGSVIGGPAIFNRAASATVPTVVVHRGATNTGWGAQASGNLSAIVSAVEVGRFDGSVTADDMRLFLFDASAGVLKRVTRGAVDSGGTGTRLLRVVN